MEKNKFIFIMIRPTRYDDDGYPLRWLKSFMPSNSLACVYSLAEDCKRRNILGSGVSIDLITIDESNTHIDHKALLKHIHRTGAKALVGMIAVQSNQFPRAVDLSQPFLEANIPVCIGGFHVSGCISMFDELPQEMKEAQSMGISFFAGEAEEQRLDDVFKDAYSGSLKPLYNYLNDVPTLEHQPTPFLPEEDLLKTSTRYSVFDLGRGCPFDCTFCTIINVQGKKSRFRTADDVERIIRENHTIGIDSFFLTDDNFARNRNWEACLDRIIYLKEKEGLAIHFGIQVDTACHKIPNFIDKCCRAGVEEVFIGLESINTDNLAKIGKKQNKISEYKELILAWKQYPVIVLAGYIVGLPNDTKMSILQDIETIKRELAIDIATFTILQPLPGSQDHKDMCQRGEWMDSDLNKYNLQYRVTHHPIMDDTEWEEAYRLCYESFYSFNHMETILRRMFALKSNKKMRTVHRLVGYREFPRLYNTNLAEAGLILLKRRKDRRPTMSLESPLIFYPKYFFQTLYRQVAMSITHLRVTRIMKKILNDPKRFDYSDDAISLNRSRTVIPK